MIRTGSKGPFPRVAMHRIRRGNRRLEGRLGISAGPLPVASRHSAAAPPDITCQTSGDGLKCAAVAAHSMGLWTRHRTLLTQPPGIPWQPPPPPRWSFEPESCNRMWAHSLLCPWHAIPFPVHSTDREMSGTACRTVDVHVPRTGSLMFEVSCTSDLLQRPRRPLPNLAHLEHTPGHIFARRHMHSAGPFARASSLCSASCLGRSKAKK